MNLVTLDVRADFRAGLHPREKIQTTLMALGAGESLRLLVPFEPVPLLHWAAIQGLTYETNQIAEGNWEVHFTRGTAIQNTPPVAPANEKHGAQRCHSTQLQLDARGLEPPQPLMRILEALASLPQGASLDARTDRRPIHLYSALEERGFTGESEEQSDGSFITHIQHA